VKEKKRPSAVGRNLREARIYEMDGQGEKDILLHIRLEKRGKSKDRQKTNNTRKKKG